MFLYIHTHRFIFQNIHVHLIHVQPKYVLTIFNGTSLVGITLSLNQVGLVGEQCLLRAICEAAKFPQADEEGLVGQIVTLLLTSVIF